MTQPSYVQTHHLTGQRIDIDLDARMRELRSVLPGHGRRSETVYKEGGLTVVLIAMEDDNVIPAHQAPGTTTVQVLDGRVALTSGSGTAEMRPGQLAAFAPAVSHDVRALDASVILLTVAAIAGDRDYDDMAPERGSGAA